VENFVKELEQNTTWIHELDIPLTIKSIKVIDEDSASRLDSEDGCKYWTNALVYCTSIYFFVALGSQTNKGFEDDNIVNDSQEITNSSPHKDGSKPDMKKKKKHAVDVVGGGM
jgi:hypothetical protein